MKKGKGALSKPRSMKSKPYRFKYQNRSAYNPYRMFQSPSAIVPTRNQNGFPSFMDVKLTYHEYITINVAVGSSSIYQFSANDCYDPNYTSTGHQPLNYDQYSALYQKWCVVRSNIVVRPVVNGTTSDEIPAWIGVYCSPTTTTYPSTENSFVEFLRLNPNCSPAKLIGTRESQNDDIAYKRVGANYSALRDNVKKTIEEIPEQFCGATSTSPSDLWFFNVHAYSVNGNDPALKAFSVEITYNVRFWEPKQVTSS